MGANEQYGYRQTLLKKLVENKSQFPCIAYKNSKIKVDEIDRITVVVDSEWPLKNGQPLPISDFQSDTARNATLNLILSIQSFLERYLMNELELVEIRTGCIKVVFCLKEGGDVSPKSFKRASELLLENYERYKATSIWPSNKIQK